MSRFICLDVASAPLANAEDYIGTPKPRKGTNDPDKQADQVAAKKTAIIDGAGLDIDLCRITAIGWFDSAWDTPEVRVDTCRTEDLERETLIGFARAIEGAKLIAFNGFGFDLPLLMRRARYLDVPFLKLNLDRYRSTHIDLMQELADRDPKRVRSLAFYIRRLGWSDLCKALSGEEESKVFASERWEDLRASVAHDVEAVRRLACWYGVLPAARRDETRGAQ